jgi:hypothetical protein
MLIPQSAQPDVARRQGSKAGSLAELRRALARPSRITDGTRQRLLDLARRLAAVRRLGDEYARVALSDYVESAIGQGAPAGA